MNEDYSYKDSFVYQRELQTKFDYFFLAVILAAVSFSIQTYDSTKEYSNIYLIILSWILFLVSFLAGFFRQERINLAHYVATERIKQKKRKELFDVDESEILDAVKQLKESTYVPDSWIFKIRIDGQPLLKSFQRDLYEYPLRDGSTENDFKNRFMKFIMYRFEESLVEEIKKDPKLIQYLMDKTQRH